VVRQLAALRAQGWPLLECVTVVGEALDPGPLKAQLATVSRELRAGTPPSVDREALLARTLRRGDAATAPVLTQLAEALDTLAAARAVGRQVATFAWLVVLGLLAFSTREWLFLSVREDALHLGGSAPLGPVINAA
jgi:hypothetical protein